MGNMRSGCLYILLAAVALVLVGIDVFLWNVDSDRWQQQLLESIDYAGALETYHADVADYGQNGYVEQYERSVTELGALEDAQGSGEDPLTRFQVKSALDAVQTARDVYLTEARRISEEERAREEEAARVAEEERQKREQAAREEQQRLAAEEEAKKQAEKEAKAAEEAKRRAEEEEKAREAERQREVEEAQRKVAEAEAERNAQIEHARQVVDASYVEPTCYQLVPSSDQILAISHQVSNDIIAGYSSGVGWDAYSQSVDECENALDAWVYYEGRDIVFSGTDYTYVYYTLDDVYALISKVSQARRYMVVEAAVERAKKYIGLNPTDSKNDPVVFVGDIGRYYHCDENCPELASANIVYPANRSVAIYDSLSRCDQCYG